MMNSILSKELTEKILKASERLTSDVWEKSVYKLYQEEEKTCVSDHNLGFIAEFNPEASSLGPKDSAECQCVTKCTHRWRKFVF